MSVWVLRDVLASRESLAAKYMHADQSIPVWDARRSPEPDHDVVIRTRVADMHNS